MMVIKKLKETDINDVFVSKYEEGEGKRECECFFFCLK